MRASLRFKVALLVVVSILVPLGGYLVLDVQLSSRSILATRVEVLQRMGSILAEQAEVHAEDFPDLLRGLGAEQPDLEVLLLGPDQVVLAASDPHRVGLTWSEEELTDILSGAGGPTWELDNHDGLPVVEISLPVAEGRALHIAEPQATLQRLQREAWTRTTFFVVGLMLLLAVLTYVGTEQLLLRRLRQLEATVSASGWQPPSRPRRGDELDDLAEVLADMLLEIHRGTAELRATLEERQGLVERVEQLNVELVRQVEATRAELMATQEELLRRERLAALGELAGSLAHEVRNPLQIIRGTAELARRRHPDASEALGDVIEEVARLERLVRSLLDYTRPMDLRITTVGVGELARRSLAELTVPPQVQVLLHVHPDLEVYADETLLQRVLVNVLCNALEALVQGPGTIEITADSAGAGHVVLTVEDDGHGVAPEDLGKLFRPFFSRKAAGTGLGLSLSRRIVEQHGGTMTLESVEGRGATVRIELPGGVP